jgi:hypothetical protein
LSVTDMKALKYALCAMLMILLAGTAFAQSGGLSCPLEKDSQVIVTPASDAVDTTLNLSVMTFQPATSQSGLNGRDVVSQWAKDCNGDAKCINQKAVEYNAASKSYQFTFDSLQGAKISVYYFTGGTWVAIPACQNLPAETPGIGYKPGATAPVPYAYYYTQCDISNVVQNKPKTSLRVVFEGTDKVCAAATEYEYNNAHVTPSTAFTGQINDFINLLSQSGGAGTAAGPLPCVGIFLIMGLLMASLYFAGKSPISLLDITTPKLPAPKGVTAGGQILAPFGYTEMKKTINQKMAAGAAALAVSRKAMDASMGSNPERERQQRMIAGLADKAASAEGSLARDKSIGASINTLGHRVGEKDLDSLAKKLPYHYGEAEQKKVAQILEAAEKMGGRERLMAMTIKDYLMSLRTYQSLEVLTAHPDVQNRSAGYYKLTSTLGKMYGSNRYNVVSGVVMAGTDSSFRTARVIGRMGKSLVTEVPSAMRGIAKTTMEMRGGPRAMEELAHKAKSSQTSAWIYGQLTAKPSNVAVGSMFPVNDKMAHLYRTLHNETLRDEMRYVLKQVYKKLGMNFNMSEQELMSMGHIDMDILKRSGYSASAELAAAEAEIRKVLSNGAMSQLEKLNALRDVAERHGAYIDNQMVTFGTRVNAIEQNGQPEHVKGIMLNQLLEEQNKVRMSVSHGGKMNDEAYVCHVGGDSLKGHQIWETMLLRTMIWDAENGYLKGGMKEELLSARLNMANRLASLNPEQAAAMGNLPDHMRNPTMLKAVAERNRGDMIQLFSEEGRKEFDKFSTMMVSAGKWSSGKSMQNASIADIVSFMNGGSMERTGHIDKKTGRMIWYASDLELGVSKNATLVDVKRHWISGEDHKDNQITLGGWVEGRFTKSYVPPYKASLEAEADRMSGSGSWSEAERTKQMKQLWVKDQLLQDMEQRFNSQFGQNAYGTTRETMRFYGGVMAGFMDKALEKLENNHPDKVFLQTMDYSNPQHLKRLSDLMTRPEYSALYKEVLSKPMKYDDIVTSKKAVVELYGGGYAYYNKGMMLSDADRIMAGEAAIRDNKGQLRKFIPEDVPIHFTGRDDLMHLYQKANRSKDPNSPEWQALMDGATKWVKTGAYDYDKQKVFAHVCWQYSTNTGNYESFWKDSGVSVEAKRQVTPVAPSALRYFGYEGSKAGDIVKPFRDIAMHGGDYVSKVALASGGSLLRTSFDITAVSSQTRMQSFRLANAINSGELMNGLSKDEAMAYRNVAIQHGAYVQVWQYAIDRNPWVMSKSFGTHQAWESMFHMGPAVPFKVRDNLRAYMGKGEYAGFMSLYGFPMDLAGSMMKPYINMMRGMQMSMQGYASANDQQGDALRQWNYTEPRLMEAMQSLNPFSAKWFPGKTGERIAKLNVFGGSLEAHQLAGPDYQTGLKQGPSHLFLKRKGVYAFARTGDVNPGETEYNYRMEMRAAQPMAEYLFREKEAAFMYDKQLQEDAMNNTMRRTVSAEALQIRRTQEMQSFGIMQNPLFGWASPLGFLWHTPMAPGLAPRDQISKMVARSKHGGGGGWGDSIRRLGDTLTQGATRIAQPHKTAMVVYCPRCNMSNYRGSKCKNPNCRQVQY